MKTTLAALCIGVLMHATSAVAQELPPSLGSKPAAMSLEDAIQAGAPPVITENALRVSRIELRLDQDDRGQWTTGTSSDWRFRGIGSEVQLELFPGEVLWMKGVSVEDAENASSWVGEVLHPEPGIAIITRAEDGVYGTFDVGTQRYALVSDASMAGKAFAKQVDTFRDIGTCPVGSAQEEKNHKNSYAAYGSCNSPVSGGNPANTTVDAMFLYTQEAVSHVGTLSAFSAFVNNLAASMNSAFSSSGVRGSIRAVYYGQQSGVRNMNSLNAFTSEARAMEQGSSPYSSLAALRNTHSADIVVLFVKRKPGDGPCGVAGSGDVNLLNWSDFYGPVSDGKAHAIVSVNCADDDRTFHHEVGHLLGGRHDLSFYDYNVALDSGCGIDYMGCGHTDYSNGFRTIMGSGVTASGGCSTQGCPRLLRFSDVDKTVWANGGWRPLGLPQGHRSGYEDFVGVLNGEGTCPATIPWVASYRNPHSLPPYMPSNPSVTTCGHLHTISWDAGWGHVGWYEVLVSPNSASGTTTNIYRGPRTSISYSSSTPVYVRVRACNASTCGEWAVEGPSNPATCQ